QAEQAKVEKSIANLLDNITTTNRDLVEQRLVTLREQRHTLTMRTQELDGVASAESQVVDLANDIARYVSDLEFTFSHGTNDEKQVALRRSVARIELDAPSRFAMLRLRPLPI